MVRGATHKVKSTNLEAGLDQRVWLLQLFAFYFEDHKLFIFELLDGGFVESGEPDEQSFLSRREDRRGTEDVYV